MERGYRCGCPETLVPDLCGMDEADAVREISTAGLVIRFQVSG